MKKVQITESKVDLNAINIKMIEVLKTMTELQKKTYRWLMLIVILLGGNSALLLIIALK